MGLYWPAVQAVHVPSFNVEPFKVVESLAEVLWKPMPMAQVGVSMVWHSVGLEGMWNFPAGHMKALTRAQVLVEVVQKNPVVEVQSEVPHEQGAEFVETPFVVVHGAAFRQELMDAVQNMPVAAVQSEVPH